MNDTSISSHNSWDDRFFSLTKIVASFSKDPSTKVGAIVVDKNKIPLVQGWNGFPRNIADTEERLNNRDLKYRYVVHAEMNCIYNAANIGLSLKDSTLYVYGLPTCSTCCLGVVQAGIKNVKMLCKHPIPDKWLTEFEFTENVFREAGVEWTIFNCEEVE